MKNYLKGGLAAAMLAGSMAATPALANDEAQITVAVVEYDDLDLSTEDGQDRLEARLRRAAHYVCGMDIRDAGSRFPSREARACYSEQLESFEQRMATIVDNETRRG